MRAMAKAGSWLSPWALLGFMAIGDTERTVALSLPASLLVLGVVTLTGWVCGRLIAVLGHDLQGLVRALSDLLRTLARAVDRTDNAVVIGPGFKFVLGRPAPERAMIEEEQ